MKRRQSIPEQWLVVRDEIDASVLRNLPRGTGVLLLQGRRAAELRRLRHVAAARDLLVVHERPGTAARVHNIRELTAARLRGTRLVLISPMYPTRSHPDWKPLGRMRAATLARLADRRAIALGGMDQRRFGRVQALGFAAWAGISTWRKVTKVPR